MRIVDRIFVDKVNAERSKKIMGELEKLSASLPSIRSAEDALKEKYFNEIYEPLRKAKVLQLLGSSRSNEVNELHQKERLAIYAIQQPMKEFSAKESKLQTELETLIAPIIVDAIVLLERELKDVTASKKARFLDSRGAWVDKGGDVERVVKVRKVEHNLNVVGEVTELIQSFISKLRGMKAVSIDQIIKEIHTVEDKVNLYDLSKTVNEEVSQTQWEQLREMKLL